ncbi:bifunctional 3'-5' exonuclease/DNA polymerase [Rhodococcus sp. NPDC058521]|uniref:bifunctional 3'-5' exonuclease/DNA polymerase n=1 Tax=Rhodococcus sp. NPDC058521 TaxID=3346536 RepID=UPI00364C0BA9
MRIVVVPANGEGTEAVTVRCKDDGTAVEAPRQHSDLAGTVRRWEAAESPRWVWSSTGSIYPRLLDRGVRVLRCHDLASTRSVLNMRDGITTEPTPEPVDRREGLFDATPEENPEDVLTEFTAQRRTIGALPESDRRRIELLLAAESAGALAAAEMSHDGLPFSSATHLAFLEETLGRRPTGYELPSRIQSAVDRIGSAFGRRINPASHAEVIDAFRREGIELESTRAHLLREIDHPAVPLLLEHRDLSKLYSTNGWNWLEDWVRDNRFRPVYVPSGVVSGRWASRGGGALQIPKALRKSVVADPDHTFVIADAGQLEPRILAAMSGDPRMVTAAGADDLYAPVAAEAFGGDRAKAKVAILGVLYGATSGDAKHLLALLRRRFPQAVQYVERAASAGERGEVVHSWLGRACPPVADSWWSHGDARARGRFTRNFVVQATASEWAGCLLADLRRRLATESDSELVFFQHDEVVVHTRSPETAAVHVSEAAESATRLLFGETKVRFPMETIERECYAEPIRPDAEPSTS